MTMERLLARARPEIRALTPYVSARSEGLDGALLLNANENPWDESGEPSNEGVNRYPEPQPEKLRARLAQLYQLKSEQLLMCRGSDEAIDLLVRGFCRAYQDSVIVTPPTFGMYALCATIQGALIKAVPLRDDFSLDKAALLAALDERVKLIFLCSPGNPGGRLLEPSVVEAILRQVADTALVIVDEAYVEFSGAPGWCGRLEEFPNLVVLRTLSKFYGLAGARLGVLIAQAPIVALLSGLLAPYPIPRLVAEPVLAALAEPAIERRCAEGRRLIEERGRLQRALSDLPWVSRLYPSDANFILLRCRDAARVLQACREAGIRIRCRRADVPDALRITVGTPEENNQLLEVLRRVTL